MKEKPAMEGRLYKDGKDIGDRDFHEKFMDMKPEDEAKRLEDLANFVAETKMPPMRRR
jgi:hypothetical protein